MASRAETLVDHFIGYLDKEIVIKWNSKNVLTCGVLADPATYIRIIIQSVITSTLYTSHRISSIH